MFRGALEGGGATGKIALGPKLKRPYIRKITILIHQLKTLLDSGVASVDNWGGGRIFTYHVLHHYIFLKSIVFKVCEHKYMNIRPSNYRRWLRHCFQNKRFKFPFLELQILNLSRENALL